MRKDKEEWKWLKEVNELNNKKLIESYQKKERKIGLPNLIKNQVKAY